MPRSRRNAPRKTTRCMTCHGRGVLPRRPGQMSLEQLPPELRAIAEKHGGFKPAPNFCPTCKGSGKVPENPIRR